MEKKPFSTPPANMPKWYVLYVRPKTEKKVGKRLSELGFEVCVPTQKQIRAWSDRRKQVEVVLFPNYVFVETDQKRKNHVFEVSHILWYVHFGKEIATLTEKEIAMVRQLGELQEPVRIEYEGFRVGEEVEILSGSLAGYRGRVVAVNGVSRIQLALPSLYCFANVELRQVQIGKIPVT